MGLQAYTTAQGINFIPVTNSMSIEEILLLIRKKESKKVSTKVYFISDGEYTKVGKSNNPAKRLIELQTGNPKKLRIRLEIACFSQTEGFTLEKRIHRSLSRCRASGEWFLEKDFTLTEKLWESLEP